MTATTTVAVVINNYNLEAYLDAALTSVISQTDLPDELIVLQPNGGQGAALNTGFARAHSDVLIFLDADDVLLPTAVGAVRQGWQPSLAKMHWPMTVIDGTGSPTGIRIPPAPLLEGDLADLLLSDGPSAVVLTSPPTSGNAWSRQRLATAMPMPAEEWRPWPDTYLLTVAPLLGDVGAHSDPLSSYRAHGDNSSLRGDELERLHRAVGYVRDSGLLLHRLRPQRVSAADVERWVADSWAGRALALHQLVEAVVPPASAVLLLDDWQIGWSRIGERPVLRPWDTGADDVEYVVVPWWHDEADATAGSRNAGGVVSMRAPPTAPS
jgi:glycosyltransferase involved in cell wall biosynthesis